jgi:anti-sigma B factor antagonist
VQTKLAPTPRTLSYVEVLWEGIGCLDGAANMLASKQASQYLSVNEVDGVAVITFLETAAMVEGEKVESLSKELFSLIDSKKYKKVVLNLYNAGYMSSAMLAQLVTLHRKMQNLKGKVRLCCLRPPVMDAFKVSQFDRLFEIFPDEPSALKKF